MLLSGGDASPGEEPDIDSKAKSLAARCWTEDEEFLAKEKIAEWLGGRQVIFRSVRRLTHAECH